MPKASPAIREFPDFIEIDQTKGAWPFLRMTRLPNGKVILVMDMNEGGQVIGEG